MDYTDIKGLRKPSGSMPPDLTPEQRAEQKKLKACCHAVEQATWKEAADELGILASNQIGNRKGLYTGIKLMEAAFRRRAAGGTP